MVTKKRSHHIVLARRKVDLFAKINTNLAAQKLEIICCLRFM